MLLEELVSLRVIAVNRRHTVFYRVAVAVVDDGFCHSAEDEFDHIEKLGTGRCREAPKTAELARYPNGVVTRRSFMSTLIPCAQYYQ